MLRTHQLYTDRAKIASATFSDERLEYALACCIFLYNFTKSVQTLIYVANNSSNTMKLMLL